MFAFSLLFTLLGAVLLTVVGYGLRSNLDGTWPSYLPIALVAVVVGPLMMAVTFGIEVRGAVIGALFALLTATVWSILHRVLGLVDCDKVERV